MLLYLLQGFSLGLPAAFMPGPLQAYLFAQTMKNGWRRTMPAALAPLLSDAPVIALALLLTTQLSPGVLRLVQIAGGLYLFYLAWGAFQTWRAYRPQEAVSPAAGRQSVWQAALTNLLNPNPYLFWGLVGADILRSAWEHTPFMLLAFLGGFYATLLGGNALTIFLFGTARDSLPRLNRFLIGFSALALAALGGYQIVG